MKLTDDQIDRARACGIEFLSASPSQVQRLSMQRRVFHIGGEPFLATRADGYFETVGTLMRMIDDHLRDHPRESAVESAQGSPAHAACEEDVAVPVPASTEANSASAVMPTRQTVQAPSPELADAIDGTPMTASPSKAAPATPVKRGRGRPRKHPRGLQEGPQEAAMADSPTSTDLASEGSGRPSGSPALRHSKAASSGPPSSAHAVPRRGPGRFRENPASPEAVNVADDYPLIAEAAIADDLPAGMATVVVRVDDVRPAQRIRGLKVPRWQIAGKLRRGRLK